MAEQAREEGHMTHAGMSGRTEEGIWTAPTPPGNPLPVPPELIEPGEPVGDADDNAEDGTAR